MRALLLSAAVGAVVVVACSAGEVAGPSNEAQEAPVDPNKVTFHKHVEPILQQHCQKCHSSGGIAPFPLVTYADAKAVVNAMVEETQAQRMPPWGARETEECKPPHPWKDDQRLGQADLATLKSWQEWGAPEGDPKDAPPPVEQKAFGLTNPTAVLKPALPFDLTKEDNSRDSFKCFVLDPQLSQTKYVNGTFFVPGNKTIVHHAIAFMIGKDVKTPPEKEGKPSDTPYTCFGGPNAGERVSILAAWAPGAVPAEYPPNVGTEIAAGSRIVMQIHYHPHAHASPDPDQTAFQVRFMDTPPEWIATTQLLGNFRGPVSTAIAELNLVKQPDETDKAEFLVPPGAVGHEETMTVKFAPIVPELKIAGLAAHMHLAGRDEKVTVKRPGQPDTCLLQEPAWDFDWQRAYQFDVPIENLPTVKGGDEIQVRCKYDNVMTNLKLGAALKEAGFSTPQPIKLGESTTSEMCLAGFVFLRKAQ